MSDLTRRAALGAIGATLGAAAFAMSEPTAALSRSLHSGSNVAVSSPAASAAFPAPRQGGARRARSWGSRARVQPFGHGS